MCMCVRVCVGVHVSADVTDGYVVVAGDVTMVFQNVNDKKKNQSKSILVQKVQLPF